MSAAAARSGGPAARADAPASRAGATVIPLRPLPLPPPIALDEAIRRVREAQRPLAYIQDPLAVDLSHASDEEVFGPQPTGRDDLPDPRAWAERITRMILEVVAGQRPAPQVVRWTTPEVYANLARRAARVDRRRLEGRMPRTRRRIVVRRVLVCEPVPGAAEASVVVHDGPRVRAVALRLEGQDGRWRVSALQVG